MARYRSAYAQHKITDISTNRLVSLVAIGLLATSVAGCESRRSTKDIDRTVSLAAPERTASVATHARRVAQKPVSVSIAPIKGVPSSVSRRLTRQMTNEMRRRNIKIVSRGGDYKLRGYLAATRAGRQTRLSYIWDMIDGAGNRVERIRGNKNLAGGSRSVWRNLKQGTITEIASRAANGVAGYTRKSRIASAASAPVATSAYKPPAAVTSVRNDGRMPVATSSIRQTPRVVFTQVPVVTGAPGNGRSTLTRAIKQQLAVNGYKVTPSAATGAYQITGSVKVKEESGPEGQKVSILWQVYDPDGRRLGKVLQQNNVSPKIVYGDWGPIANAAAGAAIKGIARLLPPTKKKKI